ncbi:uncharacterized protein LOC130673671 [Microplitis mediator]|uniref:uncharacterized protein LOC130673671 n=1 Tax=Microplitis mediator TaxID=375433 RepID=UPI00255492BE|nr:uncharacterized protein LOC130673671 [Microplitis mediator]
MNYFYTSSITIWMLVAIINLNVSSVISKLVPIQKSDPREWRENGAEANFAQFNHMYEISINEELLNSAKYSTGKCNAIDSIGQKSAQNLPYPNQCVGSFFSCRLERETEERKKAEADYINSFTTQCVVSDVSFCFRTSSKNTERYKNILQHTGNICKCLCERNDISNPGNERGKLLNSICFDPVSVDNGYVATGARFKRHGNIIYLELQQGILSQGRIDPVTLKWTTSNTCSLKQKVVKRFKLYYVETRLLSHLPIALEDLTLSENAVVTGVKLGDSLRGRYVDDDGNINKNEPEILKETRCRASSSIFDLFRPTIDLLPSTALIGNDNYERSTSCEYKILFDLTKESSDNKQHIVPFVDLQEVVTDQNSPQPIHGIGWYYRGFPGYGGYLALKIFTKE